VKRSVTSGTACPVYVGNALKWKTY